MQKKSRNGTTFLTFKNDDSESNKYKLEMSWGTGTKGLATT